MRFQLPYMPRRKANAIGNGIFFIILGILFFTNTLWPGILFAIGISIAVKQALTGRKTDLLVSLLILLLITLISLATIAPGAFLSLLFILLGVYLIGREYFFKNGVQYYNPKNDE